MYASASYGTELGLFQCSVKPGMANALLKCLDFCYFLVLAGSATNRIVSVLLMCRSSIWDAGVLSWNAGMERMVNPSFAMDIH